MNVHEYQAKGILREYGVDVPAGKVAQSGDEARRAAESIGGTVAIKAQVHAGGRGKGGGIKLARTPEEAGRIASEMIGMRLRTPQTGPEGKLVRRIYVEAGTKIDDELYLAILVDRASQKIAVIASTEGGMEIEEVAASTPDKILRAQIDPLVGLCDFQARDLAADLGLAGPVAESFVGLLGRLYRLFCERDASLVEINPLVVSGTHIVPLDCKMNFDDGALFRQPAIRELRDRDEEDPREAEADEHGLNWVSLDGDIGCMVNGAGLAMATMDIIKLAGGAPANFLDVGGGVTPETAAQAFRLILQDQKVRGILVNIFGGIVRCDVIAEGVLQAAQKLGIRVPLVVRLDGANAEQGRQMLEGSGLNIVTASGMSDAAQKIVQAVSR